jgi:non-ribosomal peptide synthetase component F/pimeloyl-ACP methyl ester carboxylesterase
VRHREGSGQFAEDKRRRLAALLAERSGGERTGPISLPQRRLWIVDRLVPGGGTQNVPMVFRSRAAPDRSALARALAEVIRRHEALRTVFPAPDGVPVQRVRPPYRPEIEHVDLSTAADPRAAAELFVRAWGQRPFDLAADPMLRALTVEVAADEHLIVLMIHHIAFDGVSVVPFFSEVDTLYHGFATDSPVELPPLTAQYLDYARLQRSGLSADRLARLTEFWRHRLAGAPDMLRLPTDRPRPADHLVAGGSVEFELPDRLARDLHAFAAEESTTSFIVVLTCLGRLLSLYGGQDDVLIGVPVAGQNRPEFEKLVGFFVNTVPMRVDLTGGPSLRDAVRRVRHMATDCLAHQDMPFEHLVAEIGPYRDPAVPPMCQVWLNYQFSSQQRLRLPHLAAELVYFDSGILRFDLEFNVYAQGDRLGGNLVYNSRMLGRPAAVRLTRVLVRLMEAALGAADVPLRELVAVPDEDVELLRRSGGDPAAASPEPAVERVAELVARWAATTPDVPAVEADGETLSYRRLHESARAGTDARHGEGAPGGAVDEAPAGAAGRVARCDGFERIVEKLRELSAGRLPAELTEQVRIRSRDLPLAPGEPLIVAAAEVAADELLWAIAAGARLMWAAADSIADSTVHGDGGTLLVTPALLQRLVAAVEGGLEPPKVRRIICAGEPLGGALEARCLRALPAAELWNVFRRAEFGDMARRRCLGDAVPGRDTVGPPVAGVVVRVLDRDGRPVPVGVPGRIHVGGPSIPGGSLRDPLAGTDPRPLRPTGDLGRFRDDGILELITREGEIEAAACTHAAVGDARVRFDGDVPVAYIVPRDPATTALGMLAERVRVHCGRVLRAAPVPASFVVLDAFPLDDTGRVAGDRLPPPVAPVGAVRPPSGETEQALLEIWRSLLGVGDIGVHDDFFRLGGHSLLAIRVMAQVRRRLGADGPAGLLFRHRTIAELAARLDQPMADLAIATRSLVCVRSGSAVPALVLTHPADGGMDCYGPLAGALAGRAVYGLERHGCDAEPREFAARYREETLAALGATPFWLGGWSTGGVIAFELARMVSERRHAPVPVVLIDAVPARLSDGAYPGEVHLIQAAGSPRSAESADAWRRYAPRLRVHRVPGAGDDLLRHPGLVPVAALLGTLLSESSAALRSSAQAGAEVDRPA